MEAFTFKAEITVVKCSAIGQFELGLAALALGNDDGVTLYEPHKVPRQRKIKTEPVTALETGPLREEDSRDFLFVGLTTALIVYDVVSEAQLYFLRVSVSSLLAFQRMTLVGGHCSVNGFDDKGKEVFWTVTSDETRALTTLKDTLVVGSDDCEIRLFKKSENLAGTTEQDKITFLKGITSKTFAFGLANNTIGVYGYSKKKLNRHWRVRGKTTDLTSLAAFAQNKDAVIISGWANGFIHVRSAVTGAILFKTKLPGGPPINSLIVADLQQLNQGPQLVAVSTTGLVSGYIPFDDGSWVSSSSSSKPAEDAEIVLGGDPDDDVKSNPKGVGVTFEYSSSDSIDLVLRTQKLLIVSATVQAFEDEQRIELETPQPVLRVPFRPKKNAAMTLQIRVKLQGQSQTQDVDLEYRVPKFCGFIRSDDQPKNGGSVRFSLDREKDLEKWLESAFVHVNKKQQSMMSFRSILADDDDDEERVIGETLWIDVVKKKKVEIGGRAAVVAEVFQDLCEKLEIDELDSEADFPDEKLKLTSIFEEIQKLETERISLLAQVAKDAKRAEKIFQKYDEAEKQMDCEIMKYHMDALAKVNAEMFKVNDLRVTNQDLAAKATKKLNRIIHTAGNLKVGTAKTHIIAASRAALLENKEESLASILFKE